MDPARLALASLRANGRILLHKTTGPGPRVDINKKEKSSQIELFSQHADLACNFTKLFYHLLSLYSLKIYCQARYPHTIFAQSFNPNSSGLLF